MVRINLLAVTIVHLGFASAGMLATMIRQDWGLCQFVSSWLGYLVKTTTLADNGVTELGEAARQAMLASDLPPRRAAVSRPDECTRRHLSHDNAFLEAFRRRHLPGLR